ncbi:MAG: hypothetical protein IT186_16005 [Acidobacteria bacterium]|nr:hypothetical protein [Acidobacteriota bacterium]
MTTKKALRILENAGFTCGSSFEGTYFWAPDGFSRHNFPEKWFREAASLVIDGMDPVPIFRRSMLAPDTQERLALAIHQHYSAIVRGSFSLEECRQAVTDGEWGRPDQIGFFLRIPYYEAAQLLWVAVPR